MMASALAKITGWVLLGSLLLIGACANGEVQTYRPSSYPVYHSPYYYPDLRYDDQDPQFWRMWQDRYGN